MNNWLTCLTGDSTDHSTPVHAYTSIENRLLVNVYTDKQHLNYCVLPTYEYRFTFVSYYPSRM
jgi:hypothetical protein